MTDATAAIAIAIAMIIMIITIIAPRSRRTARRAGFGSFGQWGPNVNAFEDFLAGDPRSGDTERENMGSHIIEAPRGLK